MVLKTNNSLPSSLATLLEAYGIRVVDKVDGPCFLWRNERLTYFRSDVVPEIEINYGKDFQDYQRQKVSPKKHLLARAVGLDKEPGLAVVDGTMGMGKDSFLLASLGAKVHGVERDPVPSFLVAWAVHCFREQHSESFQMEVHNQDTKNFIENLQGAAPDTLYLDPMFENLKGGALPKKAMAFLRERQEGLSSDFVEIFHKGRVRGFKRIVVKRPRKGEHLFGSPSYDICGKMIRYDVYFYPED